MNARGTRTRWAAIGAAVAVSLGGGAGWIASAIGSSAPSSLITIVPCRLFDTRPAPDNVGPRAEPLGAGATYVAAVTGTNGNCTIPLTATGVVMNVTAVNPTADSFLSIYPADSPPPLVSSLNYTAGKSPTPNGVTVGLSATGTVAFYNAFGSVDVVVDIVGYHEPAAAGTPGPKGDPGVPGPKGDKGDQGAPGGLPTAYVASLGPNGAGISLSTEANAATMLNKLAPKAGPYLVRLDAELDTFNLLYMTYHCKLQALTFPSILGTPFSDLPGTRRHVSWRVGNQTNESGSGVSITMQAPVTAGALGVEVRLVCWSTIDPGAPIYDYGVGVSSATLTLLPVGAIG